MKACTHCGYQKPPGEFYASKRSADGLGTVCRTCSAKRQAERRARVRDMEPPSFDARRMFWTVSETAAICRRSERSIYRMLDAGVLAAADQRGQGVPTRIVGRSLLAYLESCGAL